MDNIKLWGEKVYAFLDLFIRYVPVLVRIKSQSLVTLISNLLPLFILFLLLIPGSFVLRITHSLASRTLFLPIFQLTLCSRTFTLRLSHVLLVLSILHSVSMYAVLVEPHIQSVQRDLSVFGKRELVNLARNFIEAGIAVLGTFINVVTWRLWGLGNKALQEKSKDSITSINNSPLPPQQKSQPPQQQASLVQTQFVSNTASETQPLKEESKRLSNVGLPTSGLSKRPMAPLNHQYGFLSSPSNSNQHLD